MTQPFRTRFQTRLYPQMIHNAVRFQLESSAKIFEIEDGDPEHCFHILPRSGVLVVDKVLDAEFQSDYNLSISMRSSIDSMKQFT